MLPCRRFADVLADARARLGADVGRYSFIAVDFHHLLLAGLPAHSLGLRPPHPPSPSPPPRRAPWGCGPPPRAVPYMCQATPKASAFPSPPGLLRLLRAGAFREDKGGEASGVAGQKWGTARVCGPQPE